MYAVTGASGHLGRLVVEALLDRGVSAAQIVAIARTPGKVDDLAERGVVVRSGDYDQPDTLVDALAGVDSVLLVSGSELGQRLAQHTAVIDAAKAAGVSRVVYTSLLRADTSTSVLAPEHLATEQVLKASGLGYTILRNGWYFENYTASVGQFLQYGAVTGSAGLTPFNAAARADYAAAAAAVLTEGGRDNAVYELGGTSLTMADIAAAVGQAGGKDIPYTTVTDDEYRAILLGAGVPAGYADLIVDIDRTTRAGELNTDSTALADLVGRPLTPLADVVKAAVADLS